MGKTLPTNSLSGRPGGKKEVRTASSPASPSYCTKCRNTRAPCVWSFRHGCHRHAIYCRNPRLLFAHESGTTGGLEHLDWRYVRAVGYATKAAGKGRPKMVLLADVVSDDEAAVQAAAEHICELAHARDGEGFIAISPEARKPSGLTAAARAAIAKHTNAFKINRRRSNPTQKGSANIQTASNASTLELSIQNKSNSVPPWSNISPANSPSTKWERTCQPPNCWANAANTPLAHVSAVKARWEWLIDH